MPALPLSSPYGDYEALDDKAGCPPRPKDARPIVSETKLAIAAEMERAGRRVTSEEMREALEAALPLAAIEYHLSTLVVAGVAKAIFGPEVEFQHISQGAVPSALAEPKRAKS
jgi:hypothetical protein